MDNKDFLASTALFKGMSKDELSEALGILHSYSRHFEKNETILHAGDMTDELGLVLSGSASIENNDIWGNRSILSLVQKGEFFAEVYAILPNEPLLIDVIANEPSDILFLHPPMNINLSPWSYKFIRNLLLIASKKNLTLSGRAFHTSPKTIRERIMAYLNSVSLQTKSRDFKIPFDRQQLADYLNVERTALSKELGKMQKDGMISFHKNRFIIN